MKVANLRLENQLLARQRFAKPADVVERPASAARLRSELLRFAAAWTEERAARAWARDDEATRVRALRALAQTTPVDGVRHAAMAA